MLTASAGEDTVNDANTARAATAETILLAFTFARLAGMLCYPCKHTENRNRASIPAGIIHPHESKMARDALIRRAC
jgi:hypothetical protein